MAQHLETNDFEARQSNLVPFPSDTASTQDGIPQLFTTKDLEARYGVSNKQARNYAKAVKEAYPWLEDSLKHGQKYTLLIVEKIDEFKASGLSVNDWVASIHAANPDKLPSPEPKQLTEQADSGQLAKVAKVEVVPGLINLQSNPYQVGNFGSDRLTLANRQLTQTGENLTSTLDQTREAMRNLALQQCQSNQADSADHQNRINGAYSQAFRQELEIIQAQNMARQDARIQAMQIQQAINQGELGK
jgi:hypothetical protein